MNANLNHSLSLSLSPDYRVVGKQGIRWNWEERAALVNYIVDTFYVDLDNRPLVGRMVREAQYAVLADGRQRSPLAHVHLSWIFPQIDAEIKNRKQSATGYSIKGLRRVPLGPRLLTEAVDSGSLKSPLHADRASREQTQSVVIALQFADEIKKGQTQYGLGVLTGIGFIKYVQAALDSANAGLSHLQQHHPQGVADNETATETELPPIVAAPPSTAPLSGITEDNIKALVAQMVGDAVEQLTQSITARLATSITANIK